MATAQGREQIAPVQVTALIFLSRISLTLVYFGAPPLVRQDAWWQSFLAALTGALFLWLTHWLWLRFPGEAPGQFAQTVFGRTAGRLLVLVYALFYLLMYSLNLRLAGDFFLYAFLPRTPLIVVILVIAFLTVWAARAGVEVMGRAAQVLFPIVTGSVLTVVLLLIKEIDPVHLWPPQILHTGPMPHLMDMISVAARSLELVWVSHLVPVVQPGPKAVLRAAVRAQLWLGGVWVAMNIVIYGVLGPDVELHLYPFFTASQLISIANFIERVDSVILAIWLQSLVVRSGMLLWAAARDTAAGLGLREYRPLVLPLAALAVAYAIAQAQSQTELLSYMAPETLTPFTLLFVLVLPLMALAIAAVRGVRGKGRGSKQAQL